MNKSVYISMIICLAFWANIGLAEDGTSASEQLSKNMDSKINKMTYDDALLTLGQPTSITQGDEIFIATWKKEHSGRGIDPNSTMGLTPEQILMLYSIPSSGGEEVQLTFSKSTRLLKAWKYRNW